MNRGGHSRRASPPRVLVLSVNPISSSQSNGLMMGSLFRGWPEDRLAQIYFPFFHRFTPDPSVCRNYLRISAFGRSHEERSVEDANGDTERRPVLPGLLFRLARSPSMRTKLIDPSREALAAASPWREEAVIRYSRAFRPDVIYSLLGTLEVTRAAAKAAEAADCPILPHFTDHWIATKFIGSPFEGRLRQLLSHWLRRVIERSRFLLTMNSSMAEAYSLCFGKRCQAMTAPVDAEPYLRADTAPSRPEGLPLRLCYTGNLGLQRWRVLKAVGQALHTLRVARGIETRLEIYSSDVDRNLYGRELAIPGVEVKPWVRPTELPDLLKGADILVHVESPDPAMLAYTKFSLSTKISHYMMAGRCLLLVGPREAGSMQEVERFGSGVLLPSNPRQELEEGLHRLLTDTSLRREMGRRARALALELYEASAQRARFQQLLDEAATAR